jgi:NADH dehydrogenase
LAEQAVREAELDTVVFAPSLIYATGDRWMSLLERLSLAPVVPIPGGGRAQLQPIWVDDVVECIVATLREGELGAGTGSAGSNGEARRRREAPATAMPQPAAPARRFELAGPQTITSADVARIILRALERPRPLLPVPSPIAARTLRLLSTIGARGALPTWDEAELAEVSMTTSRGDADARLLGVEPQRMASVLGLDG